jgi:hypothetical protein
MNYKTPIIGATALVVTGYYPLVVPTDVQLGGVGDYRIECPAETISVRNYSVRSGQYAVQPNVDMALEFSALVKKWKDETGGDSSLSRITGNRHYLKIISLGPQVVPLILRELQKEPAPWFVALRVLTDELDVGKESPGNFSRMADAWIRWGTNNRRI